MTTKTMSPLVEQQFKATVAGTRRPLVDNMLVESEGFTKMSILEENSKTAGALIVEGLVGRCGVPTANKRFYGRPIMEREVTRLQQRITARSLLSAVDHPTDGKSRIMEAGAICVGLRVEDDGRVVGRYEVVEDSDGGRNLAAFLRRGASIGMSSRGLGSTRVNGEGHHVVGEDFKLHGFDFVADPACRDAYPTLVSEDVDTATVDENQLRATFGDLIESIEDRARTHGASIALEEAREQVEGEFKLALDEAGEHLREDIKLQVESELREQLREDFAAKLVKALQEQRADVEAVVRSELLSDPKVAGAKRFMEDLARQLVPYQPAPDQQVVMDDQNGEITALREDIARRDADMAQQSAVLQDLGEQKGIVEAQARSLGYRLFIERALSEQTHIEQKRELIGDPDAFATAEELRDHVSSVIEQVNDAHATAHEQAASRLKLKEHKAELAQAKAQIAVGELDTLRNEMSQKIDNVSQRFGSQLRERDETLNEAANHIERLEGELRNARQSTNEADLFAYTQRRIAGHPRGNDIMSMVESGRVTSKAQVRQLAEQWDRQATEPGGVGERIRRSLGRGHEAPSETDRATSGQLVESQQSIPGLEDFGTTMGELRHLAGIGQQNNTSSRF